MIYAPEIYSMVVEEECNRLGVLAKDALVLELGAMFGRSTVAMASVAKQVHSVDWHKGDMESGRVDTLDMFLGNINRHAVAQKIITFVGRNEVILPALEGIFSYDLVFIDASHKREDVEQDIRLIRPLVHPGSIVAFHDYGEIPNLPKEFVFGVTEAVNDFVARENARLEVCRTLAAVYLPGGA
jgi:predicted O-methyltransferase YrrM